MSPQPSSLPHSCYFSTLYLLHFYVSLGLFLVYSALGLLVNILEFDHTIDDRFCLVLQVNCLGVDIKLLSELQFGPCLYPLPKR